MKKLFKDFWKHHFAPNITEERQGAKEYQEMAVATSDPLKRNTLRQMAADEERHAEMLEDLETENQIQSQTVKSTDFDKAMNGFLVKMDEYMTTLGIKMKAVNTGFAGEIPNSLLAGQDLEGKREDIVTEMRSNEPYELLSADALRTAMGKTQISKAKQGTREMAIADIKYMATHGVTVDNCIRVIMNRYPLERWEVEEMASRFYREKSIETVSVWYYDRAGNRKCAVFNNGTDAQAFVGDLMSMGYKQSDIKIIAKGTVEQTGKKLEETAKEAENAETKEEVKSVVDSIKAVQLKRQTATIHAREQAGEAKGKSFKNVWNEDKK